MQRSILFAAGTLATALVAACAGGPRAAPLAEGLAFDCTPGGEASIAFNGGGYLPESKVWGQVKGERAQVWRSTADLVYGGHRHRMIAEWPVEGLRYRSEQPHDGTHYLVWTMRSGGALGAEDARIGERGSPDAAGDEALDAGTEIARCTRRGRHSAASAPAHGLDSADDADGHSEGEDRPHAP